MNHISKSFVSSDGRAYKSHSWELREGGYRRAALLVGNGLWPARKETRLISFLIDRGFRVISLELAFGGADSPRVRLRAFREAISSFARKEARPGIPLYLIASSFSAGALLPAAKGIEGIAAMALIAPVVEYPPPRLRVPLFFLPAAELAAKREDVSGSPELLEGLADGPVKMSFHKRDLKAAAAEIAAALEERLDPPAAAFAGEDDPYLSKAGRDALARAGARVYSYPRVKREPAHDRYADNFFADLGSYLDEVEAGRGR
jgi:hypothetical protein